MSSKTTVATYEQLKDIELTRLSDNTKIQSSQLWADRPTVIMVARRPGCQFCREEAAVLESRRSVIEDKLGTRIIVLFHERLGTEEFVNGYFPHADDVYIDENKSFYKALGGGKLSWGNFALTLINPKFWPLLLRNKRSKVGGNFQGEGRILGGLYVMKPGDGGIQFEYVEKLFGDLAEMSDILTACQEASGTKLSEEDYEKAATITGPVPTCTANGACAL